MLVGSYLWLKAATASICQKINFGSYLYWSIPQTKGPPQNCLRLGDRAKCCQKLNPSLLKYQNGSLPENQISNQKRAKIKVENPEWKAFWSPTSLKIPNLKTKVMFGLAGLSLQIKIALVGSGRRSEDFRGPILSECRGCFTLQIDRFTMGGVKMINHRGKNSSKRSVSYKFKFHPIKKQKSRAKNLNSKISWLRRVWLHSTVPVTWLENEMRKGKEIRN